MPTNLPAAMRAVFRFYPGYFLSGFTTTGVALFFEDHYRFADVFIVLFSIWSVGIWITSDRVAHARAQSRKGPRKKKDLTTEEIGAIMRQKRQTFLIFLWRPLVVFILFGLMALSVSEYSEYKWELQQNFGMLTPADDAMPALPSSCQKQMIPDSGTRIFGGGNMAMVNPHGAFSLISIADNPLLSVTNTAKGVVISGHLYTPDGAAIKFEGNHFELNRNLGFKPDRPDRHTLVVYDNWDEILLKIRFANPRALEMQGIFYYPGRSPVTVDQTGIRYLRGLMTNDCSVGPVQNFIDIP